MVDVKQRGGHLMVNLTMPGPAILGNSQVDYHAAFDGNQKIWGSGPDVDTAAGNCLTTAASMPEVTGFTLTEELQDLSYRELGAKAWSGELEGVSVRRSDLDK
ncbi:MAG: hypothetical protein KDD62_11940 [Bdellovibrionales bacterium]|nr:hypothetical protein [Bdellovibrionales bacterium]